MSDIEPFDFNGEQVRVFVDATGETWFVASDVAKVLGYRDAFNMTRRLDEEDRGTRLVSTPVGHQDMTVITEAGLYVAVLGSQVDGARAFKRWVTREVLPAIRSTGGYGLQREATPRELAMMVIEAEDRRAAAALLAREAVEALEEAKPAIEFHDEFNDVAHDQLIRDAAAQLSMREKDLREFLLEQELIYTAAADCGQRIYRRYARHSGWFRAAPHVVEHGLRRRVCEHPTIYVTPAGFVAIQRRLAASSVGAGL